LKAVRRGAERVAQHERVRLAPGRVSVHLGEHLLGLEHAPGRSTEGGMHIVAARVEPGLGERLAGKMASVRDHVSPGAGAATSATWEPVTSAARWVRWSLVSA
jgi:hypothetical protein